MSASVYDTVCMWISCKWFHQKELQMTENKKAAVQACAE